MTTENTVTPDEAIEKLKDGNRRFVTETARHPASGGDRRREVVAGQTPFATILTCSDSRVPPEIIFDCGIGDLFVIRVAGNILDNTVKGSLAYAVEHLNCPLLVVLGHSRCGAVTASLAGDDELAGEPESIAVLVKEIRKNIPVSFGRKTSAELVTEAVTENAYAVLRQIEADASAARAIRKGTTAVMAALYSLESGEVSWLG